MSNSNFSMGVPMVQIDGKKVRKLREEKGLTQLYLATAVEVTTDTISRWENRRYPAIKKDNALRLSDALEVPLEDILDKQENASDSESSQETANGSKKQLEQRSFSRAKLLFAGALLLVACFLAWWLLSINKSVKFEAVRMMPKHTAPNQPFPLVVKITSHSSQAAPFILTESIPEQAELVSLESSHSKLVVDNKNSNQLKWIKKVQGQFALGYLLTSKSQEMGKALQVSGIVTIRKFIGSEQQVTGDHTISIAPFHWADANRDNKIDDQEILAVYDDYSEVDGLEFDMELIEDIWFGSHYFWDKKEKEFVIVQ